MKKNAPVLMVAALAVGSLGACSYENPDYEPTGTSSGVPLEGITTADSTSGPVLDVASVDLPSYGEWWCVLANNATYAPAVGQTAPVLDDGGDPPQGCQCIPFSADEYAWFMDNEANGEVTIDADELEAEFGPGDPFADELLSIREVIYSDAELACSGLVPDPNFGSSCMDPQLFDFDVNTPQFEPTPLHRGRLNGEIECEKPVGVLPACGFADDVGEIELSDGVYEVKEYIFDGFVDEPACLMASGWRVDLVHDHFELHGITSHDMLATLGFANGDEFTAISTINKRYSLRTADGALAAFIALRHETEFKVELMRDGEKQVLRYRVVP